MARYRFLTASCRSIAPAPWTDGNTYYGYSVNEELPLSGVSYDIALSGSGNFAATLPNDKPGIFPYPPRDLLFIERNGQIVWAGFPWVMGGQSPVTVLGLQGESIWSYYTDHQEYRRTQKWSQQPVEQGELIYRLARGAAEDCPGGPLVLWQWNDTGLTYSLADTDKAQPQKLGGMIAQIASAEPGFDFAIVPYLVDDVVLLWWEMYRPKINFDTGLVLHYGGAIQRYSYSHNGGRVANDWRESGQAPPGGVSAGASTPFADSWDEASIDNYLHMQGSGQLQTSDQSLLQGIADQQIRDRRGPVTVTDITLNGGRDDTEFSRFSPGYFIHTKIKEGRVQVDAPFQISNVKVALTDTDDAYEKEETVTLTAVAVA